MKALKTMSAAVASVLLLCAAACPQLESGLPQSPEAQIKAGADSLTVATTVTTTALRNDKITVLQAKNARAALGAASTALDDANGALVKCRAATGSSPSTSPDPCKASVVSIIQIALDSIASVKRNVDAAAAAPSK